MWVWWVLAILLLLVVLGLAKRGIERLMEFERDVVFSITGRYKGVRGPGLIFVNPLTEVVRMRVDMRERRATLREQECITKDSVPVRVSSIVFYRIVDPGKMVVTVVDAERAILDIVRTTLRAVIGEMPLAEVIAKREKIASQLKERLLGEAERWGIEVTTVEIEDLSAGKVEDAMSLRKSEVELAEAERRAAIIKAEGEREAAEAEREAALIRAKAEKEALVIKAEGEKEAQILRAEGVFQFYKKMGEMGIPASEIALRFEHVNALRMLTESANTKLVITEAGATGGGRLSFPALRFLEDVIPTKEQVESEKRGGEKREGR